jgi:putative FmdB family regulatory protein
MHMPTYEYQCDECGVTFERFQHFSEEPLKTCPECNGPVHRILHPVGIIFKGSGFYVTDNRKDSSSSSSHESKNGRKDSASKKGEEKATSPDKD